MNIKQEPNWNSNFLSDDENVSFSIKIKEN